MSNFQLHLDPKQFGDVQRWFNEAPDIARKILRRRLLPLKARVLRAIMLFNLADHIGPGHHGHVAANLTAKSNIVSGYRFGAFIRWKFAAAIRYKARWLEYGTVQRTTRGKGRRPSNRGTMPASAPLAKGWAAHKAAVEATFRGAMEELVKSWGKS